MAILVGCECGRQFHTSDENAGRKACCAGCGRVIVVLEPGAIVHEDFERIEFVEPRGKALRGLSEWAGFVLGGLCVIGVLGALLASG